MIVPDEEQAWIAKYREAMDARTLKESRTSRIRAAWSHLTFAAVSASQNIAHRARTLSASEPVPCPSMRAAAETAEHATQPSAFGEEQSGGGSSMDEEPEHGAAASLACEAEIG